MKAARLILTIIMLIAVTNTYAQVKARKTQKPVMHSIKLGYFGLWYSLENRLAPQSTLNTELGLETLDLAPTLRLEPRYYYSLKSRQRSGKNTRNFAAEYIAVALDFDSGNLRNETFLDEPIHIFLFPKWGVRRAIGQHFIAEVAAGYGLHFGQGYKGLSGEFDFDLRLGYIF